MQGLNTYQYNNVDVDFSLCCMQIAEFSVLGCRRMLSNQVVVIDIAACPFITLLQAHLLYKLLVGPEASLLIVSHVFTILIVHAVTNYRI